MFDCRYAIVCLALPLSACHVVLADREWSPSARLGECVVREATRHEGVILKNYDAEGRLLSGTKNQTRYAMVWENFHYDASGRLIAITSHEEQQAYDGLCDVEGGCVSPARRTIERVDLEWDSGGRLRRDRRKREEYERASGADVEYIRDQATEEWTEYSYDDTGRLLTMSIHGSKRNLGGDSPLDRRDFHYDEEGRVVRHILINNSKLLRYETWEYGPSGAMTRKLEVFERNADKTQPATQEEYETLYVYEDASRLREIRFRGEPDRTYTYTGKCDKVSNAPRAPTPMGIARCLHSPHLILEMCW